MTRKIGINGPRGAMRLALAFALSVSLFASAAVAAPSTKAYAGSIANGWLSHFNANSNLGTYRFKLVTVPGHANVVAHLDGTDITYAYVDTATANMLSPLMTGARGYWENRITLTQTGNAASSHVRMIRNPTNHGDYAAVTTHYSTGYNSDGTAKKSGSMVINFYNGFITQTTAMKTRMLAHELGHVLGLGDTYDMGLGNTDSLMGDGKHSVASIGRPDRNGLYILQHRYWYQEPDGAWKYWASPGSFATGWRNIEGEWYFFNNYGVMASNTWVNDSRDRCWLNADGAAVRNCWQTIDGLSYWFDSECYPAKGFRRVGGSWLYFNSSYGYNEPFPNPHQLNRLTPDCGTGQRIDVPNASGATGVAMQTFQDNGTDAQLFMLWNPPHTNYWYIQNAASGLVLDVRGGAMANSTPVQQWYINNTAAQKWYIEGNGDDTFTIRSVADPAYCLDAAGGANANGTPVVIYQSNGSAAQRWHLW